MKHVLAALLAVIGFGFCPAAQAQEEFLPPGGKGPAVVAVSGAMGSGAYRPAAKRLAAMGYDVFLLNGNDLIGDKGVGLKAAIDAAQKSSHALAGKIGVVGFSLGGGQVLGYAPSWSDQVAVVVVLYPLTRVFQDLDATVNRIKVPVLMFAGEADDFRNCCRIETARSIAAIATANHIPLQLVTYPGVGHDFVVEGVATYDAHAANDAWTKTRAMLNQYLTPGNP